MERRTGRFTTPLSFEAQCWIAWTGLLTFGLSGLLTYRDIGAYPPLELGAVVLAVCWAIDLVRTGLALRKRTDDGCVAKPVPPTGRSSAPPASP